jgi:hypothetical protein
MCLCEEEKKGRYCMRKLVMFLVVLTLAVPVLASVNIIIQNDNGKAAIKYETTAGEHVRAFALDITVNKGTITGISDYIRGESTAAAKGYGIFPANFARYITVDGTTGEVAAWDVNGYTPVAEPNDTGALGGIGTSGVTIEMGALYYPTNDTSPNAPPISGTLCKLTVSEPCKMSAVVNAVRGGVVLTDATSVTPGLSQATNVDIGEVPCINPAWSTYNDWVTLGKPECWCWKYQCDGDADNLTEGTVTKYRIYTKDLAAVVANWKKKITDATLNPCADFDHKYEGSVTKYRVYTKDLALIVANWKKKDAALPGNCPRAE